MLSKLFVLLWPENPPLGSTSTVPRSHGSCWTGAEIPTWLKQNRTDVFLTLKEFKDKIKPCACFIISHAIVKMVILYLLKNAICLI